MPPGLQRIASSALGGAPKRLLQHSAIHLAASLALAERWIIENEKGAIAQGNGTDTKVFGKRPSTAFSAIVSSKSVPGTIASATVKCGIFTRPATFCPSCAKAETLELWAGFSYRIGARFERGGIDAQGAERSRDHAMRHTRGNSDNMHAEQRPVIRPRRS